MDFSRQSAERLTEEALELSEGFLSSLQRTRHGTAMAPASEQAHLLIENGRLRQEVSYLRARMVQMQDRAEARAGGTLNLPTPPPDPYPDESVPSASALTALGDARDMSQASGCNAVCASKIYCSPPSRLRINFPSCLQQPFFKCLSCHEMTLGIALTCARRATSSHRKHAWHHRILQADRPRVW